MLYVKRPYLTAFFALVAALFLCGASHAQTGADRATRESDRFGGEMERKAERELRRAPPKPVGPKEEMEKPKEGEKTFFVKRIELVGCESFPPEDFAPIMEKFENRDITITELNNLSKEISAEYLKRGVIAAVFLPPQEPVDQVITLQVVEARMGELVIEKSPHFRKKMLKYYWKTKGGEILHYDRIAKDVQLMNKNADREVKVTLHAGSRPGTTDVILVPRTYFPIHGQYNFDREGIMTSGRERNGFAIRDNNVLGYDDALSTGISYGKNFNGIYVYHNIPISASGASLLYGYSYSKSTPKKDYEVYSLKSEAEQTTAAIHQDIFKKDEYLGEAFVKFDAKDKVTFYQKGVGTLNKDRLRILTVGGTYMVRGEGSVTSISPEISQGVNAFGTSKKNNPLASKAGATPTFTKFFIGASNKTNLPFNLQQSLKLKAQLASEKLFSQEEYGLGGIDTVRGYPPVDYLADKMILLNAELLTPLFFIPKTWRLPYAEKPIYDQFTALTFFDYAYAERRGEKKVFRMSSVGAGLRMNLYNQVLLRLEWGLPLKFLGQDPLTEGKAPGRFHISLNIEDKIPSEIERIVQEMRKERMEKEAWRLVDEELNLADSPIRRKITEYTYLADTLHREGRLKEAREMYAIVYNISWFLHQQAAAYVAGCKAHEEGLERRSEEAMRVYKEGRFAEAKKMWEDIARESRPRALVFEF